MPDRLAERWFQLFNEIAIIAQLSGALMEARLPAGFLVSHYGVLSHLDRVRDGRTPLDLARAFQVPKTTMTHTLAGLERAGLVRMAPNPDDGRSKCVWLTEAGRAFRVEAVTALLPDMAELEAAFPLEKLGDAPEALAALRAVMDAMRDRA
jgi:DNA-binding MarR family transcriptional regulator